MRKIDKNKKCDTGLRVQSLIFNKNYFTTEKAKEWAKTHGYSYQSPDIKENTIRIRQLNPQDFKKDIFRTINFRKGIQAVVACPKADKYKNGGKVEPTYLRGYDFKNYEEMLESLKKAKNEKADITEQLQDENDCLLLIDRYIDKCEYLSSEYESGKRLVLSFGDLSLDYDFDEVLEKKVKENKLNKQQEKEIKEEIESRVDNIVSYSYDDVWRAFDDDDYYFYDFEDLDLYDKSIKNRWEDGYLVVTNSRVFTYIQEDLQSFAEDFYRDNRDSDWRYNGDEDSYEDWITIKYKTLNRLISEVDYYEYGFAVMQVLLNKYKNDIEENYINSELEYRIDELITEKKEGGWDYEIEETEEGEDEEENDTKEFNDGGVVVYTQADEDGEGEFFEKIVEYIVSNYVITDINARAKLDNYLKNFIFKVGDKEYLSFYGKGLSNKYGIPERKNKESETVYTISITDVEQGYDVDAGGLTYDNYVFSDSHHSEPYARLDVYFYDKETAINKIFWQQKDPYYADEAFDFYVIESTINKDGVLIKGKAERVDRLYMSGGNVNSNLSVEKNMENMDTMFKNGGGVKKQPVAMYEVKQYAEKITKTLETAENRLRWFTKNKNAKYPLTDSEIKILKAGNLRLPQEYKKVNNILAQMRKKKQKSIDKSKFEINYDDFDKYKYAYLILGDKYILSKYAVTENYKIDDIRYSHLEIDHSIPNRLLVLLNNLAKETGDFTELEKYAQSLANERQRDSNNPLIVLSDSNKDYKLVELSLFINNRDDYKDYAVIFSPVSVESVEKKINEKRKLSKIEKRAISDILQTRQYALSQEDGEILYYNFNNYTDLQYNENSDDGDKGYFVEQIKVTDDYNGEEGKEILEDLENNGFVYDWIYNNNVTISDLGIKFIESVKGRIETLKGVKYGYEMFPEYDTLSQEYKESVAGTEKGKKLMKFLWDMYKKETDEQKKKEIRDKISKYYTETQEFEKKTFSGGGIVTDKAPFEYSVKVNLTNELIRDLKRDARIYTPPYGRPEDITVEHKGLTIVRSGIMTEVYLSVRKPISEKPNIVVNDDIFERHLVNPEFAKIEIVIYTKENKEYSYQIKVSPDINEDVEMTLNNLYYYSLENQDKYSFFGVYPADGITTDLNQKFKFSNDDRYDYIARFYKLTNGELVEEKRFTKIFRLPVLYSESNNRKKSVRFYDDYEFEKIVTYKELDEFLKKVMSEPNPQEKIPQLARVNELTPKMKQKFIETALIPTKIELYKQHALNYNDGKYMQSPYASIGALPQQTIVPKEVMETEKSDFMKVMLAKYKQETDPEKKKEIVRMMKEGKNYKRGGSVGQVLVGGVADKITEYDLAKKYKVSVSEINRRLEKGMKVESEHTSDKKIQREIALDHIDEMLDYYDRLEIMEKQAKADKTITLGKRINQNQINSIINYLKYKGISKDSYDIDTTGKIVFYAKMDDATIKNITNYLRNNLL